MPFADLLFSYCPRCGQKAFSRKKPGLLSCSACGLIFYLNTAAAVAALRRELREEIGLEPETLLWFGSLPNEYEYEGITYQTLDLFFECMETDLSALKPLEEIQEILLLRPDEVRAEEIAFPSVRTMMRRLIERQDSSFPV
jgi:NAD+ diphosphatase